MNEDEYLPAAKLGVTKVNIDTDGRLVWTRVHREFFRDHPEQFDFRPPGKIFIDEYAKFIAAQERQARLRRPPEIRPQRDQPRALRRRRASRPAARDGAVGQGSQAGQGRGQAAGMPPIIPMLRMLPIPRYRRARTTASVT